MDNQNPILREKLIDASISFLTAVTEMYGQEKGMELWDTIADKVDDNLKGEVFFALISGRYNKRDEVLMVGVDQSTYQANRVAIIRAIRESSISRLSLKEAVDIADNLITGQPYKLSVDPLLRPAIVRDLRSLCVTVPD